MEPIIETETESAVERLEPAAGIIKRLGGEAVVREITGCGVSTPYGWQYPRDRGGTDGLIPQRHHRKLLDYAKSNGIGLTAEDFLPPAEDHLPNGRVAACG